MKKYIYIIFLLTLSCCKKDQSEEKTAINSQDFFLEMTDIDKLTKGEGPFARLGEGIFDHYWMNFYNTADATRAGIGKPHYNNLRTYQEYLEKEHKILTELTK